MILAIHRTITIKELRQKTRDRILNWNLFEVANKSSVDPQTSQNQQQSTRVYLILLAVIFLTFSVYASSTYKTKTMLTKIPSLEIIQYLQKMYGSTIVTCPCTKLSITHSSYIQLEPIFHQICSSDFISTEWLNVLFASNRNRNALSLDLYSFNVTAFIHFQTMRTMCDLVTKVVINSRDLFLASPVVSRQMLDFDEFSIQTQLALNHFQSTLPNNFIQSLEMFRGLAQGNGLVSAYSTNWNLFIPNMTENAVVYIRPQLYENCSCAISSACIQPSQPFLPGFVVGCMPLESFLRSTIECLYKRSCVDQMVSGADANYTPRVLNMSSRFAESESITVIVQQMFIEQWSSNVSYDSFFEQCKPTSCSYALVERHAILDIATTLLGIYGGITVGLRLIAPLLVQFWHNIFRKIRQTSSTLVPY
ncbi:unnamed protein product [Rotaria socialis]|uniref:Uncharacterized protein n=1 Tax=Rotaria socialis TaxID=392032 RepID=A0A818WXM0_9BILA|nr:unnamed protein product [Rotaria socialis]CAF4885891.1 unnamed protein product [Rotaria socialis]